MFRTWQRADAGAARFGIKPEIWTSGQDRCIGATVVRLLSRSSYRKGPIVSVLQKYDFFVIFPVDPSTLAYHRKAFSPSGAKDDPTDAELALDLLFKHSERFKPLAATECRDAHT